MRFRLSYFLYIFCLWLMLWTVSGHALAETGEAPDVLYKKGLTVFQSGDYSTAIAYFAEILDRFGNEPQLQKAVETVLYALGCSYYNTGQFAEAIETFTSYAEKYPEATFLDEALFRIGTAHQNLEEFDKANSAFKRMRETSPNSDFSEDALFQRAVCFMEVDKKDDAQKVFHAFREMYPRSPLAGQAAMYEARLLFENGKLEEALTLVTALHSQAMSLDFVAYINFLGMEIGDEAFNNTDYELALKAYRQIRTRQAILRMQRNWVESLNERLANIESSRSQDPQKIARQFRDRRRIREQLYRATALLDQLENTPSYDAGLWHRIGRCFFAIDRYWEARVAYRRVVDEAQDKTIREQAHFDLILVLNRMRRFDDLVKQADLYLETYGDDPALLENGRVATVAFIRAECYVNQERFEEAEPEMTKLLEDFPDHKQRARIEFYIALSVTMQERFKEGVVRFDDWLEAYPNHMLNADVQYWKPIAYFYGGYYDKALPLFDAYAAAYPMSVYTPEAKFRAALCDYSLENFEQAAQRLTRVLQEHPGQPFQWEALIAKGDALAAMGRLEEAVQSYRSVGDASGPYYYMALKQLAKVYRALDTEASYRDMAQAFAEFIKDRPESGNIVEAAFEAGWALRQIGRTEQARKLYWNILARYGNNRTWEGFTTLLNDLKSLYTDDDPVSFEDERTRQLAEADRKGRFTLAARLRMAGADRQDPADCLRVANSIHEGYAAEQLGPELAAFIGQAMLYANLPEAAQPFFEQILRDTPESSLKPEAHLQLSKIYIAQDKPEDALSHALLAVEYAWNIPTLIEGTFMIGKSRQQLGDDGTAIDSFTTVLANRAAPPELKAEALLRTGDCYAALGKPDKAVPYYQRVYVLYRAFTDTVAQAYWKSGKAFEKLNDRNAAIRTYQELMNAEDLSHTPQAKQAQTRLKEFES